MHVVYGLVGLKTHSKITLVVRREAGGLRRYLHLATGNYNAVTAGIYTDMGLLTCDPAMAADATELLTPSPATPRSNSTGACWSRRGACAIASRR